MNERKCVFCAGTDGIQTHHVFGGTSNRKQSDIHGLTVDLCAECHDKIHGVTLQGLIWIRHGGVTSATRLDDVLHIWGQMKFEETHSRDEFRHVFGRSWL
jgi:hypothetical protein